MKERQVSHEYKVNEIFYSIQGEGERAGAPSVFVRFSGCNLKCPWCDTDHERGELFDARELESRVDALTGGRADVAVVLTGGEPTLQLHEDEPLFPNRFVCIETNGTHPVPSWVDWSTLSPKSDLPIETEPDELKLVFEPERIPYYESLKKLKCPKRLQPLDRGGETNLQETLAYVLANPEYSLSLQTHKLIGDH